MAAHFSFSGPRNKDPTLRRWVRVAKRHFHSHFPGDWDPQERFTSSPNPSIGHETSFVPAVEDRVGKVCNRWNVHKTSLNRWNSCPKVPSSLSGPQSRKRRTLPDKEGTYQDIVSAPDVWNQIMVELGLSLNVLSFKPV